MTFTKIAVVGGLLLFGLVCWLAASGFGAAREGVISFVALVALVAGGNLLSGRGGPYSRRRPTAGDPVPAEPAGDLGPGDEPAP